MLNYKSLKKRQRLERADHPPNLALRVHRALSWLDRAEQCEDQDGRFIFLWIAFNAAYANDLGDQERPHEKQLFRRFLNKLARLDEDDMLYAWITRSSCGAMPPIPSSKARLGIARAVYA